MLNSVRARNEAELTCFDSSPIHLRICVNDVTAATRSLQSTLPRAQTKEKEEN